MRRRRVVCALIAMLPFLCLAIPAGAQVPGGSVAKSASPTEEANEFEVATVKPHPGADYSTMMGGAPGRFTATNITAKVLVEHAFGVPADQVSGGPSWADTDHFDINAKISDARWQEISKLHYDEQNRFIQEMVQNLLKERFQLAISHRPRELTVYALVVAKGGTKLRVAGSPRPDQKPLQGAYVLGMTQNDAPLDALASFLSVYLGRTVLDRTGLTGRYDISFYVTNPDESTPDAAQSAVFTALEDQLGLKLISSKETVDTIVIEHLEQPSEN